MLLESAGGEVESVKGGGGGGRGGGGGGGGGGRKEALADRNGQQAEYQLQQNNHTGKKSKITPRKTHYITHQTKDVKRWLHRRQ